MTARGEVWWADVDKRRPVLIVHNDGAAARIAFPLVAPITTTYRGSSTSNSAHAKASADQAGRTSTPCNPLTGGY